MRRWRPGGRCRGCRSWSCRQYVEQLYARELLADRAGGVGYLLKDRVFTDDQLWTCSVRWPRAARSWILRSLRNCWSGAPGDAPITRLTGRERDVLALMAEGRSNAAIAQQLFVSEKAVSKHCTSIFAKLDLPPSETDNAGSSPSSPSSTPEHAPMPGPVTT